MEKTNKKHIFISPLLKENPILVLVLGMCPVLGVTSSIDNAIGMGAAVILVLLFTNTFISLIKKWVPNEVRIPVYIVIIACFVTIVEFFMKAFTPELASSLGIFIPMITVNCIILGRAESFASKNSVGDSVLDALGTGIGFLIAVLLVAFFREFLATGGLSLSNPFTGAEIFSFTPLAEYKMAIFGQNPGAFLTLGIIIGIVSAVRSLMEDKKAKRLKALAETQKEAK